MRETHRRKAGCGDFTAPPTVISGQDSAHFEKSVSPKRFGSLEEQFFEVDVPTGFRGFDDFGKLKLHHPSIAMSASSMSVFRQSRSGPGTKVTGSLEMRVWPWRTEMMCLERRSNSRMPSSDDTRVEKVLAVAAAVGSSAQHCCFLGCPNSERVFWREVCRYTQAVVRVPSDLVVKLRRGFFLKE